MTAPRLRGCAATLGVSGRGFIAAALALTALLSTGPAWAEPEQLKLARYNFEYGKYADAIKLVDELNQKKLLADGPELVEAWRIHALSNFYLGERAEARSSFVKLLSIDPDYRLDPLLVPPLAIVEFDLVKKENEALLAPIRERRRAIAEQIRLEEEARRKLLEEEERKRRERDTGPALMQRVEKHAFLTNFLPFGAAQVEQNRGRAGAVIAVAQGLTLASSVLSYSQVMNRIGDDGYVKPEEVKAAETWRTVNWISMGAAGAVLLGGIIDAVVHYQEETVTYVAVGREELQPRRRAPAPAEPAAPPPSAPPDEAPEEPKAPEPAPAKPNATFFLMPVPNGAAAGLFANF